MIRRLDILQPTVYAFTGILGFFVSLSPIVGVVHPFPPWTVVLFWIGVFCLLAASARVTTWGDQIALLASALFVAVSIYRVFVLTHSGGWSCSLTSAQTAVAPMNSGDLWLLIFGRAFWILLLIFSAASLMFSLRSVLIMRRNLFRVRIF